MITLRPEYQTSTKTTSKPPTSLRYTTAESVDIAITILFNKYAAKAHQEFFAFTLDRKMLAALITRPCFYCQHPPYLPLSKETKRSEIDRVDPYEGYHADNVVAACKSCIATKARVNPLQRAKLAKIEARVKKFYATQTKEKVRATKKSKNKSRRAARVK